MKEEIEKYLKKFKEFFGGFWQGVCLVIALLLLSYLAGISLKFTLPVIALLWAISEFDGTPKARKTLGIILRVTVLVVFIGVVMVTYFPRINRQAIVLRASIDQVLSKTMGDRVEVSAKDRWDIKREAASNRFFTHYDALLAAGKTNEAADTLAGFKKTWDMETLVNLKNQSVPIINSPIQPISPVASIVKPSCSLPKDSVFTKGTYYLDVEGETPFRIKVKSRQVCHKYELSSENDNYDVVYNDGTIVSDGPSKHTIAQNRENPIFKLRGKATIKMVVN